MRTQLEIAAIRAPGMTGEQGLQIRGQDDSRR
jgi:hypothetical protein